MVRDNRILAWFVVLIRILVWLVKITAFINCTQLQGLPIYSHTFTWVRCMIKSCIYYYKSCENPYQVLQAASEKISITTAPKKISFVCCCWHWIQTGDFLCSFVLWWYLRMYLCEFILWCNVFRMIIHLKNGLMPRTTFTASTQDYIRMSRKTKSV